MSRLVAAVTLIGVIVSWLPAGEKNATPDEVRKSIERSLPFIEKEGLAWIKKRDCMSCHVVSYMLWAHNEARARGIKVDLKKLDDWTQWSMGKSMGERTFFKLPGKAVAALPESLRPKLMELIDEGFTHEMDYRAALAKALNADELKTHETALVKQAVVPKKGTVNDGGGVDTLWQLLLGRYDGASVQSEEFDTSTAELLIRWQENDGTWKAAGQLPSRRWARPAADQTTTMWSLLALANYRGDNPAVKKAIERGHAAVKKAKSDPNLEWLAVRLLYEHRLGDKEHAAKLKNDLLRRQNADGGWSVTPDKASEAFSTGQSLYLLSHLGISPDPTALARGQRFLLDTQQPDGSWITPPATTSQGGADRLKKLEPIYRSWGTMWAAIGLARSLPEAGGDKKEKKKTPQLEDAYRAWHEGFQSNSKQKREKTLRSMLVTKKDVEYLFPKHADKLWDKWAMGHEFLVQNVDKIATEVTKGGAITRIKAIDVRTTRNYAEQYEAILKVIPNNVPVYELIVEREKVASGGGSYLYVHDRWAWVKDLANFPRLLESLK